MKLSLRNFRCYVEKDFDFGEDGLVLLSGQSGSGKSTIMMAITFALYGTGNKLCTFGKTSLKVVLTFCGLQITRTKKPNRLVLKRLKTGDECEYEDESAQGIINDTFGTSFDITSYLKQNGYNSFITMSPSDKLDFLEKFAFNGVDLSKIKNRAQSILKKRNEELISASSKLEMAISELDRIGKPKKIKFPFKTSNEEKFVRNESIRLKNTITLLKKSRKELAELLERLTDVKIRKTKEEGKRDILDQKIRELENILSEKNKIQSPRNDIEQMEKILKVIVSEREKSFTRKRLGETLERITIEEKREREKWEKQIAEGKNNLWKETPENEAYEILRDYSDSIDDFRNLERYELELKNIGQVESLEDKNKIIRGEKDREKELENSLRNIEISKKVYPCPSCDTPLRLSENGLEVFKGEILDLSEKSVRKELEKTREKILALTKEYKLCEIKSHKKGELTEKINSIRGKYSEIMSVKEIEENIRDIEEYIDSQKRLAEYIKKPFSYSDHLILSRKQVQKELKQLGTENSGEYKEVNEETLRKDITKAKNDKEKYERLTSSIRSLEKDIENIKSEIEKVRVNGEDIVVLENRENELVKNIKELEQAEITHNENLEKIKIYMEENKKYLEWKEWKDKKDSLLDLENKARDRYSASSLLKEKILQAESIAILNIINSINIHAQEYLDIFFPNDPIVVRLCPFKETKKTSKPQINIEIDYKGMEADINMLSGGELARVILAYTLALSEIFNSPLIMLDECTASLDGDTTSVVMEGIKTHFRQKLVVIIAHQVIEGDFDRKICL